MRSRGSTTSRRRVTGYSFVISLVVGIVLTFIAAMLPARRASQMPPAAALRTEV